VVAGERDRPDIARRRAQWTKYQKSVDPERLVFIDDIWTRTRCEAGRRAATGSLAKFHTAAGKP